MIKTETQFVVDAGNTRVKLAQFEKGRLEKVSYFKKKEFFDFFSKKNELLSKNTILSSVLSVEDTNKMIKLINPNLVLNEKTALPFINKYATPNTLGADRKANAAFAASKVNTAAVLIVDIGTCIKFDLVNEKKEYLGGSISPGIHLRYKAMNDYTGKLPLLDKTQTVNLIGANTEKSIWSGVINGISAEIFGLIAQYQSKYSGLTTFMSGGDVDKFDIASKNHIFADENLTLKGLHLILEYNAH